MGEYGHGRAGIPATPTVFVCMVRPVDGRFRTRASTQVLQEIVRATGLRATHLGRGTSIPADAMILSAAEVEAFGDRMFPELRCAAEDLATAIAEDVSRAQLRDMAGALLDVARDAERLR